MGVQHFVNTTIISLKDHEELYEELRALLRKDYIDFYVVKDPGPKRYVMREKLCDYFEKVTLKTGNNFNKLKDEYIKALDQIVGKRIAKEVKLKNEPVFTPRARKYYEKAKEIIGSNKYVDLGLMDYTRIMLCLYMSIINNDFNTIDDFDYSLNSLNLDTIINSMKSEIGLRGRYMFTLDEPYYTHRCIFVMLILMFYYIKSKEVEGEY